MSVTVMAARRQAGLIKGTSARQRLRRTLLLVSVLAFPVTLNYLSPYVILDGASQGIVNGSLILFAALFVSSLFLGRAWCGWVCPGGGLQDCFAEVQGKSAPGGRLNWLKWVVWLPWVAGIVALAVAAGGYRTVNALHLTEQIVSVDEPMKYVTYYTVIGLFVALSLVFGRRAGCHYVCWMAPYMIVGRWIRNRLAWPSLRLAADAERCSDCLRCTRNCPMSLDVNGMVRSGRLESAECILCGTCVDNCPKGTIRYSFSAGR